MRTIFSVSACLLTLALCFPSSGETANSTEADKAGSNQGLTFEDLGRGLKSAVKNIEEEIPKIGPAIADTFKKVTGNAKEKDPSKPPSQQSTKTKR
ncbi:MAG: hypothetical protein NBKEAIPA_02323 [Nitrospirae bacterium]|nr:MAG: hypothetical protein UZ03_NOB001002320 [Nitrospira sp. OLB3]MBV6470408.1 hypothetical protein [Nitrospirota bacterium]MCE7965886.1 hypothetical protein [Nitrospira sp. NTP2]MEB2339593.1 hypothetical protein [Nitrospirales bacterium]NUQ35689.1 hypothetical protein [Planctomycetaceae bacterium]QOJ36498.1 MAG: hypothetical protein HRU82_16775 [Nitrospira sp.]